MQTDAKSRSWGGRRSGAGRPAQPGSRRARRKAGNLACDELLERIAFIHDCAGDVARDNIKTWKCWPGSAELHAHAVMMDLDDLVLRLGALLSGDDAPFSGTEWQAWKARRDARLKIN